MAQARNQCLFNQTHPPCVLLFCPPCPCFSNFEGFAMRDCPGWLGGLGLAPRSHFLYVRSPEPHEPGMFGSLPFAARGPVPAAGTREEPSARGRGSGPGAGMGVKPSRGQYTTRGSLRAHFNNTGPWRCPCCSPVSQCGVVGRQQSLEKAASVKWPRSACQSPAVYYS